MSQVIECVNVMLEIDTTDTRLLFWEEMKRVFFALCDTEPKDSDI